MLVGIFLKKNLIMLLIKYYLYISIFYTFEMMLFFFLKSFFEDVILLNIFIRTTFVIFSSLILKRKVFHDAKYFYQGYYLIAAINPLLSSLILFVIINFFLWDILVIKFLADLATSLFSYFLIRKL